MGRKCSIRPAIRDLLTAVENGGAGQPWQRFPVKDGEKGAMVWEAKQVCFYPNGPEDVPLAPQHLIVARSVLEPDKLKFFVADAPQKMPVSVLLHVAFSRWRVERSFEDQ